jgi:hypothetical protein
MGDERDLKREVSEGCHETSSEWHQGYRNFLLLLFSPFSSFGTVPKEEKGKPKESFGSFGPKAHKARPLACLHLLWAYQT